VDFVRGESAEKCFGGGKRNLQSKLRDVASIFFPLFGRCLAAAGF